MTIAAGIPVLANLPDMSSPGVIRVHLIGSSRLKPSARSPKPCHLALALSIQSALVPMPFGGELVRAPDLEPPVLAVLAVDLAHRAPEVERLGDALLDQRLAAGRFHHRRRDVARRDDRVLRARRAVHQVGLVEEVRIELPRLRVLHQHLRRLADAGEQLVRRLGREDDLVLRPRALPAHRVELAVEVVEGGVRQPGLVEVHRVDVAVERVLDRLGVVEHAVVGALRQRQDARLDLGRVDALQQRMRGDLRPGSTPCVNSPWPIGPMIP